MNLKLDCSKNYEEIKHLRKSRNMKLTEIHKILLQEKRSRIKEKVEQIEQYKDDPRRRFQVIKEMQREKPQEPLFIQTTSGALPANPKVQCKIIAEHFQPFFKTTEPLMPLYPQAMINPFTSKEVHDGIRSLINGRTKPWS